MTNVRNATLQDLGDLLKDQHSRKVDVVAPASKIISHLGALQIEDTEPVLTEDGVSTSTGTYLPTSVCDEGIADKLGIPIGYLRKMRENRVDLYDDNVNGWLEGNSLYDIPADKRSFLVRCFRPDDGSEGIARAFLSDRYRMIDNLDVLLASLDGISDAGVDVSIEGCDLTDRRMYLRVVAPEVTAQAEALLKGYRNPFGENFDRWRELADREGLGYGGEEPIVFAGFVVSNSEVGDGAFSITPRAVIRVCKNGLTLKQDMMRDVHLGAQLDAGVIDWSADTQQKSVDLVRAKTRDAVKTFLSADYLKSTVERLEERADEPVTGVDKVTRMVTQLKFSNSEIDGVLNRFVQGGQMTRGGVMNAITAHAQTVEDADTAHKLEEQAVSLLV